METGESDGRTGYLYFPIEFTTKVFSILMTFKSEDYATINAVWATPIDKTKFLNGAGMDFHLDTSKNIRFNIISVGF